MNTFAGGFSKQAAIRDVASKAKDLGSKAVEVAKGIGAGAKDSMNSTIGEHLQLRGLRHIGDAAKSTGGFAQGFKSPVGRRILGEGVGKAAPSIAAGAAYAGAAKKVYNKATGSSDQQTQQYY